MNNEQDMDNEKNESTTKIASIDFNNHFKLPIYYNNEKINIKQHIITDLELVRNIDPSCNPMYSFLFDTNKDDMFSDKIIEQVSEYYTTDINFLKDNQLLIKTYESNDNKTIIEPKKYDFNKMIEIWNDVKNDTGFKEKYYYIDWSFFEFLNNSEHFLQIMSIYNMASPIITFLTPIILLIIPFFVIKLKGVVLTIPEYVEVLKIIISNHAIGKLFTEFNDVSINQKIYLIISAAFYIFSVYQNILICIRFNSNMKKIHNYFNEIKEYLGYTIDSMNNYLKYSTHLQTQQEFNNILIQKINVLREFKNKISNISEYKVSVQKMFEIGHIMKYFYELYDNKEYNDAFLYSFGFNGYIQCIKGLISNVKERKINMIEFVDKKKKNIFKNNYYAALKNNKPIKNTVKLQKNMIITGPNASGKTTILKSTLINIIFTQQFGCGFYDSGKLKPYKYIHCYLNIPDTSGRDSLFQAEARRCKEIIDIIDINKNDTHFCVFDELYSGTNPDEAIISAVSFMEYLVKNKNMSCLLTTHYHKVCKILNKNNYITNSHMEATKTNDKISYSYKLDKGISEVKGGINVLCDMNYPKEIIDNTIKNKNINHTNP